MPPLAERDANIPPSPEKGQKSVTGRKRPREDASPVDTDSINIPEGTPLNYNCNQIRAKIRKYIESGEMKVGEFRDKLGVTGGGYSTFMQQNGPDKGMGSDTFMAASAFFMKRELAGVKMPQKKVKRADDAAFDVSDIHLDGEEDETVPIFDTCDEVRKKINAHLRNPAVVRAAWLREISKTGSKNFTSAQLNSFLSKKGPKAGNSTAAFYAAYVYFEKMRIKKGTKKSKHRQEMEKVWDEHGMDRIASTGGFTCRTDEVPVEDKYGMVTIQHR